MSESDKELMFYPSVIDYLERKHKIISEKYITEDGVHSESCYAIATEIAELLKKHGEKPYIMSARGNWEETQGVRYRRSVTPKIYSGTKVSWGCHLFCANGNIVFDPIVGKPMEIEEYRTTVFIEPVNIDIYAPVKATAKLV
jgi:hypothetical protein